jgi:hypothetical protein
MCWTLRVNTWPLCTSSSRPHVLPPSCWSSTYRLCNETIEMIVDEKKATETMDWPPSIKMECWELGWVGTREDEVLNNQEKWSTGPTPLPPPPPRQMDLIAPKPTTAMCTNGAVTHDMMMLPAAWLHMIGRARFGVSVSADRLSHIARARAGCGSIGRVLLSRLAGRGGGRALRSETPRVGSGLFFCTFRLRPKTPCRPSHPSTTVPVVRSEMLREKTAPAAAVDPPPALPWTARVESRFHPRARAGLGYAPPTRSSSRSVGAKCIYLPQKGRMHARAMVFVLFS